MAFDVALGFVPDSSIDEVAGSGTVSPATMSFDEIEPGSPSLGIAQLDSGAVLLDPDLYRALDLVRTWAAEPGRAAYLSTFSCPMTMYSLEAYGSVERVGVRIDGEQVEDRGAPLPAETATDAVADEFEEDRHIRLTEVILGASWADILDGSATPGRGSDFDGPACLSSPAPCR